MANVNMALDEIIRRRNTGGGGVRRPVGGRRTEVTRRSGGSRISGGAAGGRKLVPRDLDDGKWVHDKFADIYGGGGGGGKRRAGAGPSSGGGKQLRVGGGGIDSDIVKVIISNLSDRVVTADLEELFHDFGIYGVSVHYDELGQHLGSADLFVGLRSAKDILREFGNIEIDGLEVGFAIVDESAKHSGGRISIQDRIRRVNRNPIHSRKEQPKRLSGGGPRARSPPKRRSGGVGPGPGPKGADSNRKKPTAGPKKAMTVEELDKQLESYMGSRHPAIQEP